MRSYATEKDASYKENRDKHLQDVLKSHDPSYVADNFAKYVRRQELTRFLVRHELFKKILPLKGSIVECGVFSGNGLMTWAQLSAILEPLGVFRQIFGFDTFDGFPSVDEKDLKASKDVDWKAGDLRANSYEELLEEVQLYDQNRFLPQFDKVSLIKGDFMETSESFLKENPHVIVSLLYIDFDLYEPSKRAIEVFLPRMPKGSIIAFDEVNHPLWPGETLAMLEALNIRDCRLEKFSYEPNIGYIVL